MKKNVAVILTLLAFVATGCRKAGKPRLSWDVTLSNTDTAPYGTYLAYALTKHYFPDADIETLPSRFRYTSIEDDMRYPANGAALLVAVGLNFRLNETELDELLTFVRGGNEVVIFCSLLDEKLEKKLRVSAHGGREEYPINDDWNKGETNVRVLTLESSPSERFGHFGRDLKGYFELDSTATKLASADTVFFAQEEEDSVYNSDDDYVTDSYDDEYDTTIAPDILGRADGKPNFLRRAYGRGHLTVHLAPLALSNYFLLQKNNRRYIDAVWSTLPKDITSVYWHQYFKRSSDSSSLAILWRHPATRWALLLSILALGLYVLFESKRRQRVLPIVVPPQNTSVAFVETVGRLYHARGDHANLAAKMVQHFLEGVRNAYGLQTTELNDAFAAALARKSGCNPRQAAAATYVAREVRGGNFVVTEQYIHHLYATLQPFHATTQA